MGYTVHLLGRPRIEHEGQPRPGPRGGKAWALLAYLVLCPRPPARRHLAELLFPEAEDPLAALRWNLSELRRAIGQAQALRGDPVRLTLGADTSVDVLILTSATPEALATMALGDGELLESVSTVSSPAFEVWLLAERRRLAAVVEAALREQVLLRLAAADALEAARLAARLVAANPFEEGHHELLIRSLLSAGDRAAANVHLEACGELFRQELGTEAHGRLGRLLQEPPAGALSLPGAAAAAQAQLEAGQAALAAGATEVGIEVLRRAAREAGVAGDGALRIRVLLALGSALVHTMRGHEEAAMVLHQAAELAVRLGEPVMAATAYREIGFIDVQAGRRQRARIWLARAEAAADGCPDELASIHGVRGMDYSDAAHYPEAVASLEQSLDHAGTRGQRQTALSRSLLGRVHLLAGRYAEARRHLRLAVRALERARWLAFRPWPEALLAEADIEERRLDPAHERLEHAFALACQLGDPCWEGVAARGLGRVEAGRVRPGLALAWLADARKRCLRPASPYQWVHGWILDGLAEVTRGDGESEAVRWARALETVATRGAMREFVVRACLHRHRLGDDNALHAARLLAADIDNPRLRRSVH
jgi:DNA-binding SARP family transcriptional activator